MFSRLLQLLICLTVLVCPATGRSCCAAVGESRNAGDGGTAIGEDHGCCHGEHSEVPSAPEYPDPCHDCFCAGALPPGFNASVEATGAVDVTVFALIEDSVSATGRSTRVTRSRVESPLYGRTLLTAYCRFLL